MARPQKLYDCIIVLVDGTARFSGGPYRSKELALAAGEKAKANPPDYWAPIAWIGANPVWVECEATSRMN